MSREIPWVYAEEIDWNVGDVWLVELKDEVVEDDKQTIPWVVVQVSEALDFSGEPMRCLFPLDENSGFVSFSGVLRGLRLETSEGGE